MTKNKNRVQKLNKAYESRIRDFIKNTSDLVKKSQLTHRQLSNKSNLPRTTFGNVMKGRSLNPGLHTIASTADMFNLTIAQIIGEVPINYMDKPVPILQWSDLDLKTYDVKFKITEKTEFTSSNLISDNKIFALNSNIAISDYYQNDTILIIEQIDKYSDQDIAILSINNEIKIYKIIKKNEEFYFAEPNYQNEDSKTSHSAQDIHVFGIIREVRFTYAKSHQKKDRIKHNSLEYSLHN